MRRAWLVTLQAVLVGPQSTCPARRARSERCNYDGENRWTPGELSPAGESSLVDIGERRLSGCARGSHTGHPTLCWSRYCCYIYSCSFGTREQQNCIDVERNGFTLICFCCCPKVLQGVTSPPDTADFSARDWLTVMPTRRSGWWLTRNLGYHQNACWTSSDACSNDY